MFGVVPSVMAGLLGVVFMVALALIVASVVTVLAIGLYVPIYSIRHHQHHHPISV